MAEKLVVETVGWTAAAMVAVMVDMLVVATVGPKAERLEHEKAERWDIQMAAYLVVRLVDVKVERTVGLKVVEMVDWLDVVRAVKKVDTKGHE